MKRMWSVLRVGLIIGATVTLVPCNVIQGELTLLVEEEGSVYSPCWSSDGSKIYFVVSEDILSTPTPGQVWSIELEDRTQKQVSEENIQEIDISPDGDLCVTYLDGWIRVLDTETWTQRDSIAVPEEAKTAKNFYPPKFSHQSDKIIYYLYYLFSDSSYLHKVNLVDSTDELILTAKRGFVFAPGPGDTLFALGDTIYNLNSKERIPIGIDVDDIETIDWNPAIPTELVITTGPKDDLFVFSLETTKLSRIDVRLTKAGLIKDASFSPDGERVAFATLDAGGSCAVSRIWLFEPSD